ncbi:DUF2231 domain-containing protein [Leifsonia sp. 2MCAF36]|uniref:DUF2231 domain-containing protein n=1 Tax=Leifsonia sp. 2MCAF36 TaxID=3232988 RepID=UPI003F9BFA76
MTGPDTDSGFRHAKRPRSIIAGPYGHPFHAILVTIPIGAWTAAVIFDIAALLGAAPHALSVGALWLVVIGVIGGLLAAIFGLLDFSQLPAGTKVRRIAVWHLLFNSTAIVLFVISAIVRAGNPDDPSVGGFILALIGILVVGVSGTLGGELAYRHGVRVADERDQERAYTR